MEAATPDQGGLPEELSSDVQSLAKSAKQRLEAEADARKGTAASQVKNLSSALGNAAGQLGPDSPTWIKSALEQTAKKVNGLAQTIEAKDARQLRHDVQRFARDNPATFLAGCAVAGFAAARIFKAGAETSSTPTAPPSSDQSSTRASGAERSIVSFSDPGGGDAALLAPSQGEAL